MIYADAPLRISLGGGGTDLPSYYQDVGGWVFAAAIRPRVRVTLERWPGNGIAVQGLWKDQALAASGIRDARTRAALQEVGVKKECRITVESLVPPGAGLGGSGAYLCALLAALAQWRKKTAAPDELAATACRLEMDVLGLPSGKQDPYVSAYGGFLVLEISRDGRVTPRPVTLDDAVRATMARRLRLFFTGRQRDSADVLSAQQSALTSPGGNVRRNMDTIRCLGQDVLSALKAGRLDDVGDLFDRHWALKKQMSGKISGIAFDRLYDRARANGARGGKLVGAGGGGFFLFYVREEDQQRLREALASEGLEEKAVNFSTQGVLSVTQDRLSTGTGEAR